MAVHRLRVRLRFTTASGMATWCRDNMAVRYGQALHLNEGLANEEQKRNEIIDDGSHQIYECDLPLMNEAHAIDAFSTLTAILPWAVAFPKREGPGYIERHTCLHDADPPQPCTINQRTEVS